MNDSSKTLLTSTDKANIFLCLNGVVLKSYYTENAVSRVLQDQRSLQHLNKKFKTLYYNGWTYGVVKYLSVSEDRKGFFMEYIPGQVLSVICKSRMQEAEYHCGIWMGLYHNCMLGDSKKGLIFTDLNVHNIIIDFENNRVTVIDPGMTWGRSGFAYEDLIKHVNSIFLILIIRNRASLFVIAEFLKGYTEVSTREFDFLTYYKGWFLETRREFSDFWKNSVNKGVVFAFIILVQLFFYILVIPGFLYIRRWRPSFDE